MNDKKRDTLLGSIPQPPKPGLHDGTALVGDTSHNNLSWWFPKLVYAKLPVPRTRFVSLGNWWSLGEAFFDGKESLIAESLLELLKAFGDEMGWPCFLRTGYFSGKHDWKNTCFVENREKMGHNVSWLAQMQEMVWVMDADTLSTWCVREMLPTKPVFHCKYWGNFPVTREFRFFVDGQDVRYHNPYWPEDALKDSAPDKENWKEILADISRIGADKEHLTDLASKAGAAMGGGRWSIDIIETENGWYITDMAMAQQSYGFDAERFEL